MDASIETLLLCLNGEQRSFPGPMNLAGLVGALTLDIRKVAIELNREIVPRSTYAAVQLNSGDSLEIVHFIGGG
jgi:thiamine biosynthesis protein ThiS